MIMSPQISVKILFLKSDGVGDRSLPKIVRHQISNLVTLSLLFYHVMIQQESTYRTSNMPSSWIFFQ